MPDLRFHPGQPALNGASNLATNAAARVSDERAGENEEAGVAVGISVPGLAALIQAAGEGDEEAWRKIIDLYARRVYALARSRLGASRDDLAEEITQSVFVTVASKLGKQNSSGVMGYTEQGRFESWLFRVAMNRIRDEIRRSRRQAEPTDPDVFNTTLSGPAARDEEDLSENLRSLRSAMGKLADADREVVELRHHAGLSFKQIAELLAEPLGTLLARHHRALRKLKELMAGSIGVSDRGTNDPDNPDITPAREGATT